MAQNIVRLDEGEERESEVLEIIIDLPFGFPINNIISLESEVTQEAQAGMGGEDEE